MVDQSLYGQGFFSNVFNFEGGQTGDVFEAMIEVVDQWSQSVLNIVSITGKRVNPRVDEPSDVGFLFSTILIEDAFTKWNASYKASWKTVEKKINHYRAAYRLVTDALGLDMQTCENHRLVLAASSEYPPCIGLMKARKFNQAMEKGMEDHRNVVTVCTSRPDVTDSGCCLLETIKTRDGTLPRYQVVGVWVPQRGAAFFDIGAMVDAEAPNG